MTLGSLFDGIGGFLLAARHAGVTPVWASEIEPFPQSVTARHFPDVKQLGDITKIDADEIEPVDIVCAGSPCQDLSIAGKRKGLNGERSGLFRTAVELVRRMRERTSGKHPRFFVWENVPGAFSSNRGMDFQAVLEEIGQSEIPMPQGNRWASAGLVQFPGAEIAWRVLDAQYWGMPQRRRRIFLVADFAASGRCAGEILFECEGVSWNIAAGTGTGEGASGGAENCARATNEAIAIYDMTHADEVMRPVTGGIVPTLNARMGTGGNQVPVVHIDGIVRRLTPDRVRTSPRTSRRLHRGRERHSPIQGARKRNGAALRGLCDSADCGMYGGCSVMTEEGMLSCVEEFVSTKEEQK